MQIPQGLIDQFKALYKEKFDIELTDEEAQRQGRAVMRLVAARLTKGEDNE